jgi:hypothetical protein
LDSSDDDVIGDDILREETETGAVVCGVPTYSNLLPLWKTKKSNF